MKYFKISELDLRELLKAANYAWALEQGGVDNWEWEWDARNSYVESYNQLNDTHFEYIEEIADDALLYYEEAQVC